MDTRMKCKARGRTTEKLTTFEGPPHGGACPPMRETTVAPKFFVPSCVPILEDYIALCERVVELGSDIRRYRARLIGDRIAGPLDSNERLNLGQLDAMFRELSSVCRDLTWSGAADAGSGSVESREMDGTRGAR